VKQLDQRGTCPFSRVNLCRRGLSPNKRNAKSAGLRASPRFSSEIACRVGRNRAGNHQSIKNKTAVRTHRARQARTPLSLFSARSCTSASNLPCPVGGDFRFDLLDILRFLTRGGAAGPLARSAAALPRAEGLKAVGLKSRTAVQRGQKASFHFFAFSTALLFSLLLSRAAAGAQCG
jgi:hypothetical protein